MIYRKIESEREREREIERYIERERDREREKESEESQQLRVTYIFYYFIAYTWKLQDASCFKMVAQKISDMDS